MPGNESGGVDNMWYSFDYGLAHFIALDSETDFAYSPSYTFERDLSGNETFPMENETYVTDAGPFGYINGSQTNNKAYQQYQFLKADLENIDRTKTPWIVAMSHRPMYSSETASYQKNIRNAWQELMLSGGVDAYLAGHIHWYERLFPLTSNGTVDASAVLDNHTYMANEGVSMTHLVNGAAGNIESHSTLPWNETKPITAVLNQKNYGFGKLTFHNESAVTWQYIYGVDGSVGDEVTILKNATSAAGLKRGAPGVKHLGYE